jgi:hypothetical protein
MFACALALSLIPLPYTLDRSRNLVLAIGFGILGIVYVVGLTVYQVWSFLGSSRNVAAAFAQLGLKTSSYALFGRQYHGTIQERQVDVYFIPPYRYYPGSLEVYLDVSLRFRLAVAEKRPLLGCDGCRPLHLADSDLSHLQVLALDEDWARNLLADPTSKAAVLRLTANQSPSENREFYVQPGALLLRMSPDDITAESIDQWLRDLVCLAQVAESLPPPVRKAEATGLEAGVRARGDWLTPIITVILLGSAVSVLLLCLGAVIFALTKKMH